MRTVDPKITGLVCLVTAIVLMVLVGPVIDEVVFGLHEHVSSAESRSDASVPAGGPNHAAHHCDLSMSPADVAPASILPVPVPVAVVQPDQRSSDLRDTSFDLLIPPRA